MKSHKNIFHFNFNCFSLKFIQLTEKHCNAFLLQYEQCTVERKGFLLPEDNEFAVANLLFNTLSKSGMSDVDITMRNGNKETKMSGYIFWSGQVINTFTADRLSVCLVGRNQKQLLSLNQFLFYKILFFLISLIQDDGVNNPSPHLINELHVPHQGCIQFWI